jgi:NitT/TauT family transport system substrate-binding protein
VDGIPTYTTRRAAYEAGAMEKGLKIGEILFADYGFDMYGLTLFSSEDWIQAHSDVLRAFLKATYQGIRWTMENPSKGIELFLRNNPTQKRGPNMGSWRAAVNLMISEASKKHGLGYMTAAKVQFTRDLITKYQNVEIPAKVGDLYTNDYLPKILPPK